MTTPNDTAIVIKNLMSGRLRSRGILLRGSLRGREKTDKTVNLANNTRSRADRESAAWTA